MSNTVKYLLDANLVIAALDKEGTTSESKRLEAKQRLIELLSRDDVALAVTPLICYEVLRGIPWSSSEHYQAMAKILDGFMSFDITRDVADLAAGLYRFDGNEARQSGIAKNLDKRKFDVFHYACSIHHDLQLASADSDFTHIDELYQRYRNALS